MAHAIERLAKRPPSRLVLSGNAQFFSAGADLNEIAALTGPKHSFFPDGPAANKRCRRLPLHGRLPSSTGIAWVEDSISPWLAIVVFATPHALFGHPGAALGLITGWGGTQRLPRLVGKARALQMFLAAEKVHASRPLQIGLVDAITDDPFAAALAMRLDD